MNFFKRNRIIALAVTCIMLFGGCAAAAEQAMVMSKAAVYASADTSSEKIATLDAGTRIRIIAEKNGWAKVSRSGHTAYMKADSLGEFRAYDDKPAYADGEAPMYKQYSEDSKRLGVIPSGNKVIVKATAGEWAAVVYGKHKGFVLIEDLTTDAPAVQAAPEAQEPEAEEMNVAAYASTDGAKVYNSKGRIIGTLDVNTAVTIIAERDGLCRVQRSGKTAYMKKSQLSTEKVEVEEEKDDVVRIDPKTFYVQKNGAKVYNSKGKVIGSLDMNDRVSVDAYNEKLARVRKDGNTGLMYRSDLAETQVEIKTEPAVTEITPTAFYVKTAGAKVYNSDREVIGTLDVNDKVTVSAYTEDLARVSNGSTSGYMLKSDLSSDKVSVSYALKYGDKGEAVKTIQQRLKELGYFSGSIGGNYLELTQSAVTAFQKQAKLDVTGVCNEETLEKLFSDDAPKKPAPVKTEKEESSSNATGPSTAAPATGTAIEADWWTSDIQSVFARGVTAKITDVSTGMAWYEKRTGGTNHADVQPLTAADTAAMRKAVGSWSWNRRAIFVTIDGVNYAASMNCMPHGSGTSIKDNNFNGHHCIHFTNSRTHGGNKVCSLHQAAIKKALSANL